MGYREAAERAKQNRPEPVIQAFVLDDELYHVPIRRLDGQDWALVTAEAPPEVARDARLGFNTRKAAMIACGRHAQLLDADKNPVPAEYDEDGKRVPVDWGMIFAAISGTEVDAIAAIWWAMNVSDPNERVVAAKKASAGGS